jgi:hypothetical protein
LISQRLACIFKRPVYSHDTARRRKCFKILSRRPTKPAVQPPSATLSDISNVTRDMNKIFVNFKILRKGVRLALVKFMQSLRIRFAPRRSRQFQTIRFVKSTRNPRLGYLVEHQCEKFQEAIPSRNFKTTPQARKN